MYVAVSKIDPIGLCEESCSGTALKDLGVFDVNVLAGSGFYAFTSTAVYAHILDIDITALFELKNSVSAVAHIFLMT